ncbi:hypothetical protein GCM10023319_62330 [Nocardia iowensis]
MAFPQFGGECDDAAGIGDIQHAPPHLTARVRGLGDLGRRGGDSLGIATGEQHQIGGVHSGGEPLGQRSAQTLIRPGHQGNACHVHDSKLGTRYP